MYIQCQRELVSKDYLLNNVNEHKNKVLLKYEQQTQDKNNEIKRN